MKQHNFCDENGNRIESIFAYFATSIRFDLKKLSGELYINWLEDDYSWVFNSFFTFFRVFTAFLYILVEHSVEEMSFYFERNNMILKRLDFGFFSLLVGISITLFERFAKWAENAESGGYLRGVVYGR